MNYTNILRITIVSMFISVAIPAQGMEQEPTPEEEKEYNFKISSERRRDFRYNPEEQARQGKVRATDSRHINADQVREHNEEIENENKKI